MTINAIKDQLIRISNIDNFLVKIPTMHPDSDNYDKLWSKYTKYCIEGFWGLDGGKYRYMPGTLFFYGNFWSILDFDETEKVRRRIKPVIRDIDWMLHYAYLEAQGFSGWSKDDEYTSDYLALDIKKLEEFKNSHREEAKKRYLDIIDSKGNIKKFINPRENIKMLHDEKKGAPLYHNYAKNLMVFGSRGEDSPLPL